MSNNDMSSTVLMLNLCLEWANNLHQALWSRTNCFHFSPSSCSHFSKLDLIRTSKRQSPEMQSYEAICCSSPGGNSIVGRLSGAAEASKAEMETSYVSFLMKKSSKHCF